MRLLAVAFMLAIEVDLRDDDFGRRLNLRIVPLLGAADSRAIRRVAAARFGQSQPIPEP